MVYLEQWNQLICNQGGHIALPPQTSTIQIPQRYPRLNKHAACVLVIYCTTLPQRLLGLTLRFFAFGVEATPEDTPPFFLPSSSPSIEDKLGVPFSISSDEFQTTNLLKSPLVTEFWKFEIRACCSLRSCRDSGSIFFYHTSAAFRTQWGRALTMRYGIPRAITPTPTISSIIGFWNMPIILKDCGGTKYWFFCLGCSLIG